MQSFHFYRKISVVCDPPRGTADVAQIWVSAMTPKIINHTRDRSSPLNTSCLLFPSPGLFLSDVRRLCSAPHKLSATHPLGLQPIVYFRCFALTRLPFSYQGEECGMNDEVF